MDLTGCLIIITLGFLLMFLDLILPTGGVLFALGMAATAIGSVMSFGLGLRTGLMVLLGEVIVVPLSLVLIGHWAPQSQFFRKFVLALPRVEDPSQPVQQRLEHLKGRIGKTLSHLRPAGAVDFDGYRVDTLSEGMLIEPGQYVRCIEVRGGKVIVRAIAPPETQTPEQNNLNKLNDFEFN